MSRVPVDITFRHIQPTGWIKELIEEQADKLHQHAGAIHRVEVTVDLPQHHSRKGDHFEVRIVMHVDHMKEQTVSATSEDNESDQLRTTIHEAFHQAERMMRRKLERRRDLRRTPAPGKGDD